MREALPERKGFVLSGWPQATFVEAHQPMIGQLRIRSHWTIPVAVVAGIALLSSWAWLKSPSIVAVTIDPKKERISLHWKDERDSLLGDMKALERHLQRQQRTIVCAMNAGMYAPDRSPQGLYVENGRTLFPLDTATSGHGNFYMLPNGVFAVTYSDSAFVCSTPRYPAHARIRFATQSGPLLVINGRIHERFTKGSKNLNIRNGVGVKPDGNVVFAISTEEVNFHDFAAFFLEQGCTDALYLDGSVSKAIMPDHGLRQYGGHLGPLIAVTRPSELPKY